MNPIEPNITRFLDEEGRINKLPAKASVRIAVISYLANKFEKNRVYSEKEVNNLCNQWHTFNDFYLLRRCLIDDGFFERKPDGSAYWRIDKTEI